MKTILLSQMIHPAGYEMIKDRFNVVTPPDPTQATFDALALEADGIVLRTNLKVSGEVIRAAKNLKIISRTGAGVDNIDLAAADKAGVMICNTPAVNNVSVAEHAVALMLSLAKQLPLLDTCVRTPDRWKERLKNHGVELFGKTLGVVGIGAIGSLAARICANGFGMRILVFDPYADPSRFPEYAFVGLPELFSSSDFITLHCPSLPDTRGLVNHELIGRMKPSAYLVNCARGDVVDTAALYDALAHGRIAGAGLDVFAEEPIPTADALLSLPNVIVSPHAAALTKEASQKMSIEACRQVIDYFEGRTPPFVYRFNRERN